MKHTQEPWNNDEYTHHLYAGYLYIGTTYNCDWDLLTNQANAARIVACVNACAGMDDPEATIKTMRYELDRFRTGNQDAENREIAELKAQRDELLEALEMASAVMTACDAPKSPQRQVRELIAKMKGTNP